MKTYRLSYTTTVGFGNLVCSEIRKCKNLEEAIWTANEFVKEWKNLSVYRVEELLIAKETDQK